MKWLALVMLVGCAVDPAIESESDDLKFGGSACSDWMCGTNSPVMDGLGFHQLFTTPTADPQGFILGQMTVPGYSQSFTVSVVNGTLRGGGGVIAGQLLHGARITMFNTHTNRTYTLSIDAVDLVDAWAGTPANPAYHPELESYEITWSYYGNEKFQPLCPHTDPDLGLQSYHAVVFEGDVLDPVGKLDKGIDANQFNIGCAGSTVAKLALTGHTQAGLQYGFKTSLDDRTTMIKMLSADYCGDGTAFTVAGQPLTWTDDQHTMTAIKNPAPSGKELPEAVWSPTGALCLEQPRVAVNPTDASKVIDLSKLACSLPKCLPRPPKGHLTSINLFP